MVKSQIITLRVEPADKTRWEEVAKRLGMTLTSFVESAARVAASRIRQQPFRTTRRRTVPKEFLNICHEARKGGSTSYGRAAEWLLDHLGELLRDARTDEEWKDKIRRLKDSALDCDLFAVAAWFEQELPKFYELIPSRRNDQFLTAVINIVNEHGLKFDTDYE